MTDLVIIGAGGHAGVIVDILHAQGRLDSLRGFIDGGAEVGSTPFDLNAPILGPDSALADHAGCGFIIGIGAIKGGGKLRRKLFDSACVAGLVPTTLIHPSAVIARRVDIGAGTAVMANVVINTGTQIGTNSILNTGCLIEHDIHAGEDIHVAPQATLLGNCSIGDRAMIGSGAVVLRGLNISIDSTVGAGSVVTKDTASGSIVYGSPAIVML